MARPATAPRTPGKRRWLRWLVFFPGLILAGVLAAGLLFRHEAAAWLARGYLEGEGITVASLRVDELTSDTVEIGDLVLGDGDEASAETLRLVYALDVFSAKPVRVELEDLKLRLDLSGQGPPLGSLQAALDRLRQDGDEPSHGSEGEPAERTEVPRFEFSALPALRLSGAEIIAETGTGPMSVTLDGEAGPTGDGAISADLTASADSALGRLSAALDGRLDGDGTASLNARIDEGTLAWQRVAVDQFAGTLGLRLTAAGEPSLDGAFSFSDFAFRPDDGSSLTFAAGEVSAGGDLGKFTMTAALKGGDDGLRLEIEGGLGPPGPNRKLDLVMAAELVSAGDLASYLSPAEMGLQSGSATLLGELTATLPGGSAMPRSLEGLLALMETAEADLQGDVLLADVALVDGSQGISAHLPFAAALSNDRLDLRLRQDGEARVEQPAVQRLLDLGVPEDLIPLVKSGLTLTLASGGARPFALAAKPGWPIDDGALAAQLAFTSDQGLATTLDYEGAIALDETGQLKRLVGDLTLDLQAQRFSLGGREARSLSVSLPLSVDLDAMGLEAALANKGKASVQQLGGALPLRLTKPLRLTVEEATISQEVGAPGYRYRLVSRSAGIDATLQQADDDDLTVALGATAIALDGRFDPAAGHDGSVDTTVSRFTVPAHGLVAETLSAKTNLDRDLIPAESRFTASLKAFGQQQSWLRPLDLDGTLKRRGAGYDLAARAVLPGGTPLGNLTARYEDKGTATANLRSESLLFAPGDLQPAEISPLLEELEEAAGALSLEAELAWPLDPMAEWARIEADDLTFRSQGMTVEGLSLDLNLQSLLPMTSAPEQRLTIRRIDSAAAIDDIALRFSLGQEPSPHVKVAGGAFRLGGADWRIEPTRLDPTAVSNRVVLATDNLDLDTFFRLIEIEGLSGSGILSGSIPIDFDGESVIVDNGHLKTDAGGKLSLRSDALTSALAGGGEIVELAIQALADFRYDNLSVTVNKSATNEAQVKLGILGHNPAVLDGQPFQFNINLESNLTSVLEALQQGYSLSDEALRRAWRLR